MLVPSRRRLRLEMWIVLGLSLGQSAVYSVVQLLDKMTRAPLAEGTSTLNRSQSSREYFDLTYQLLDIIFALVPVVLVIYFLTEHRPSGLPGSSGRGVTAFQKLGLNFDRPGRDLLQGVRPGGAASASRRWASTPPAGRSASRRRSFPARWTPTGGPCRCWSSPRSGTGSWRK